MSRIFQSLSFLFLTALSSASWGTERFFIGMGYRLNQGGSECSTERDRNEMVLDLETDGERVTSGVLRMTSDGQSAFELACTGTSAGAAEAEALGGMPPDICSFQSAALPDSFLQSIQASRERDGHIWPKQWQLTSDFGAQFLYYYSWHPPRLANWPICPLASHPASWQVTPQTIEFGAVDQFGGTWIRESAPVKIQGNLESGAAFTTQGKLWIRRVDASSAFAPW